MYDLTTSVFMKKALVKKFYRGILPGISSEASNGAFFTFLFILDCLKEYENTTCSDKINQAEDLRLIIRDGITLNHSMEHNNTENRKSFSLNMRIPRKKGWPSDYFMSKSKEFNSEKELREFEGFSEGAIKVLDVFNNIPSKVSELLTQETNEILVDTTSSSKTDNKKLISILIAISLVELALFGWIEWSHHIN